MPYTMSNDQRNRFVNEICYLTYFDEVTRAKTQPSSYSSDGIPVYSGNNIDRVLLEHAKSTICGNCESIQLTSEDGKSIFSEWEVTDKKYDSLITEVAVPLFENAKEKFTEYVEKRTLEAMKDQLINLTRKILPPAWLGGKEDKKHQLLKDIQTQIESQDFKTPSEIRHAAVNFTLLSLQKSFFSRAKTTSAVNKIIHFFNNPRDGGMDLKRCLFPNKNTNVTYDDLLGLTNTDTKDHVYLNLHSKLTLFSDQNIDRIASIRLQPQSR